MKVRENFAISEKAPTRAETSQMVHCELFLKMCLSRTYGGCEGKTSVDADEPGSEADGWRSEEMLGLGESDTESCQHQHKHHDIPVAVSGVDIRSPAPLPPSRTPLCD